MEYLAPPLDLCVSLRLGLESGQSVARIIKGIQARDRNEMARDLAIVVTAYERGESLWSLPETTDLIYRKALLNSLKLV